MKHPLNLYFDHIFCINLVESTERRKSATERFERLGLDVEFYEATRFGFTPYLFDLFFSNRSKGHDFGNCNEIGCTLSHYTCIKIAKERGYKNVLILEDDVIFLKNFNDIIQSYLDVIPKDFDAVYLYSGLWGWNFKHRWIENSEDKIFTSNDVTGCIAYGVNSKFYDKYLEGMDNCFQICDNYCSRLQNNPEYKFYSLVPNLCAQPANTSTINPNKLAIIDVFPHMKSFMGKGPNDYE